MPDRPVHPIGGDGWAIYFVHHSPDATALIAAAITLTAALTGIFDLIGACGFDYLHRKVCKDASGRFPPRPRTSGKCRSLALAAQTIFLHAANLLDAGGCPHPLATNSRTPATNTRIASGAGRRFSCLCRCGRDGTGGAWRGRRRFSASFTSPAVWRRRHGGWGCRAMRPISCGRAPGRRISPARGTLSCSRPDHPAASGRRPIGGR